MALRYNITIPEETKEEIIDSRTKNLKMAGSIPNDLKLN